MQRRVLETWGDLLSLSERPPANPDMKNLQGVSIIIMIIISQQNSRCRLCGDRDETINHIISECSKLA